MKNQVSIDKGNEITVELSDFSFEIEFDGQINFYDFEEHEISITQAIITNGGGESREIDYDSLTQEIQDEIEESILDSSSILRQLGDYYKSCI